MIHQIIHRTTYTTYVIGFASSVILTALSFYFAAAHVASGHVWPPHPLILYLLLGLAALQFIIQAFSFLHLGIKPSKRMNGIVFVTTLSIVFVIVVGSIWIMDHLNRNMTPQQMEQYTIDQS